MVQASYMSMYIHVIESDVLATTGLQCIASLMYMSTCMIPWLLCGYAWGKATLCAVKISTMADYQFIKGT